MLLFYALCIPPCRPLLVHNGPARPVAGHASPRAVAVVGVSGGMAVVARPRGIGVMVVMVVFRRGHDLLAVVVVVLLPLWLDTETHFGRNRRRSVDG